MHDVIIIGGSYAGMAAALQLVRARRTVLVIDAGQRRNRFASHSHGFLGQDGADPAAIAATARGQLEKYPTLHWIDDTATALAGTRDAFTVTTTDGVAHHGHRIIIATGVSDTLPEIPGLRDRWGKSLFHCPYCHGYELGRQPVAVIGTSPASVHQAHLVTEWGAVTFLTNGVVPLDDAERSALLTRNVVLDDTRIARIEGEADVILSDGRRLAFAGLFIGPRTAPSSPLAGQFGCELEETPMGVQLRVDASRQTSVPGIYACGDVARTPHSVSLAVGDGAMTGMQVHRGLVFDPLRE